MGFRCPICKKDFKNNKVEWQKHVDTQHLGAGAVVVKMVREMAEALSTDEEK